MNESNTTMEITEKIAQEVRALANFYGMNHSPMLQVLESELLGQYVEIVLCENRFELVLGGLGQAESLMELANAQGFHPEVLAIFRACDERFPGKMLYTKFCGPDHAGNMYFVLLEPWEHLTIFLAEQGFSMEVILALQHQVKASKLCFLLGFSYNPQLGGLSVKTYHLAPRDPHSNPQQPFLISWRLGKGHIEPAPKVYSAKVDWKSFQDGGAWERISAQGQAIWGSEYEMLKGQSPSGQVKAYVFRHDIRQSDVFSLKSYNYYVEEGNRLIDLGALSDAEQALRFGTYFAPGDVDAWNRLGYVILMQGRYLEGIRVVLQAKALNPNITNLIWIWANPIAEQDAEIERLTTLIADDPQPQWYNARAIYHFHMRQYPKAKEDLLKAIELEPMYAEAHNNLGGVWIKLGEFAEAVKSCTIAHSIQRETNQSNLVVAREGVRLLLEAMQSASAKAYVDLGKFYYQVDLFEDSERCFRQAEETATMPTT